MGAQEVGAGGPASGGRCVLGICHGGAGVPGGREDLLAGSRLVHTQLSCRMKMILKMCRLKLTGSITC